MRWFHRHRKKSSGISLYEYKGVTTGDRFETFEFALRPRNISEVPPDLLCPAPPEVNPLILPHYSASANRLYIHQKVGQIARKFRASGRAE